MFFISPCGISPADYLTLFQETCGLYLSLWNLSRRLSYTISGDLWALSLLVESLLPIILHYFRRLVGFISPCGISPADYLTLFQETCERYLSLWNLSSRLSYTISGDLCSLSLLVESLPLNILHYFRRVVFFISSCGISPVDYLTLFQESCVLYLSLLNLSSRLSYTISGELCSLSLLVESLPPIILHYFRRLVLFISSCGISPADYLTLFQETCVLYLSLWNLSRRLSYTISGDLCSLSILVESLPPVILHYFRRLVGFISPCGISPADYLTIFQETCVLYLSLWNLSRRLSYTISGDLWALSLLVESLPPIILHYFRRLVGFISPCGISPADYLTLFQESCVLYLFLWNLSRRLSYTISGDLCSLSLLVESLPPIILHYFRRLVLFIYPCGISPAGYLTLFQETSGLYLSLWNLSRRLSYNISGDLCSLSLLVESLPPVILHYFRRLVGFISPCGISPADYLTLFQETCGLYPSLWNLSRRLSYTISGDLWALSLLVESLPPIILHYFRRLVGFISPCGISPADYLTLFQETCGLYLSLWNLSRRLSYTISGDLWALSLLVESLPQIILHYFRRLVFFISPCGISPADYLTLFQETCGLYPSLWNLSRRLSYTISGDLWALSLLVESLPPIILHYFRRLVGFISPCGISPADYLTLFQETCGLYLSLWNLSRRLSYTISGDLCSLSLLVESLPPIILHYFRRLVGFISPSRISPADYLTLFQETCGLYLSLWNLSH